MADAAKATSGPNSSELKAYRCAVGPRLTRLDRCAERLKADKRPRADCAADEIEADCRARV